MSVKDGGTTAILVVEDSPTQAVKLQYMLLKQGFDVGVAQNGALALEAMRSRKPDIVISDIVMPEMDGYELCRSIRKDPSLRDTSILLLTSLSEAEEVLHALECGADYFITKPYEEEFLVARIRGILAQRTGDAPREERSGDEIVYHRKNYAITTDRRRILDLLLSTYESTIRKNAELQRAHDELRNMNERLECAVTERTRAFDSEKRERQRAEEALQDLKHTEKKLVERHKDLSVLYQVATVISETRDLRDLCMGVLAGIAGLGMFRLRSKGTIFLVEDGRFVASHRLDVQGGETAYVLAECEKCLAGLAVRTGEIVLSRDSGTDERYTTAASPGDRHGHVVVPLKSKAGIVGVLCLCLDPESVPEADGATWELLGSLGNQIAVGIENARLYERTRYSSLHDPLTGLPNRRNMEIFYDKAFAQTNRGIPLSVLIFDIDRFKRYNDTHGHSAGDQVLVSVGKAASAQLRDGDLICRYGGEEFLVVCQGLGMTESHRVAERIRCAIERETDVTVSVGVATYYDGVSGRGKLIEHADSALYRAKKNGRNRVEIHVREEENPADPPPNK